MTDHVPTSGPSRRQILAGGAGILGGTLLGSRLLAGSAAHAAPGQATIVRPKKQLHLVGTDGWVSMPSNAPADPPFFPDSLAPSGFNTYVFGFRDVTGMSDANVAAQRGKAQISAPVLVFDEEDDVYITLTNLGLVQRPDLYDGHTLHWHGFVNAIPLFDGVPELSLAVPIGRDFTYFYRPHDAGTYMYHCHFEDVEHVQMGMTGSVFIRPRQNQTKAVSPDFAAGAHTPWGGTVTTTIPKGKYAYNDYDGSTRYDREFAFMVTELWSAAHYRDAHIQVNDWTDFDPSFWLLNGRAYPDTVQPNGTPNATSSTYTDPSYGPKAGLVSAVDPTQSLQYQPNSSLITCNPGERVLLRLANLGYQNHTFTVDNIDLSVVAKDASLLVGRDGTKNYITTNSVDVGPGESRDVMFTAPSQTGTYLLYDRKYSYLNNGGGTGYGGMMTEIRVGSYAPQTMVNG